MTPQAADEIIAEFMGWDKQEYTDEWVTGKTPSESLDKLVHVWGECSFRIEIYYFSSGFTVKAINIKEDKIIGISGSEDYAKLSESATVATAKGILDCHFQKVFNKGSKNND